MKKNRESTKETGADVALMRIKLDQVIKEAIKVAAKICSSTDAFPTVITTQFTNLKDATANTLAYFLRREPNAAAPPLAACS